MNIRRFTIVHLCLSCILWLMGLLDLICNLLHYGNLWEPLWFYFVIFSGIPFIFGVIVLFLTFFLTDGELRKKYILQNAVILAITAAVILFTLTVTSTWMGPIEVYIS